MKKLISSTFAILVLIYLSGCSSMNQVTREEFKNYNGNGEISVLTKDNEIYKFHRYYSIESDTLEGKGVKLVRGGESPFKGKIALDYISGYEIHEVENPGLGFLSVIVGASLTIALTYFLFFLFIF
jgi:uncharacterized lipoprotein